MSAEEYARRKGTVQILLFGGGVVVIALFAVQLYITLGATRVAVEHDPLSAGSQFFQSAIQESQEPLSNIESLKGTAIEIVDQEIRRAEAKDAVISKLKEGLAAEPQASDSAVVIDDGGENLLEQVSEESVPIVEPVSEGELTEALGGDTDTWNYEDQQIEETQ